MHSALCCVILGVLVVAAPLHGRQLPEPEGVNGQNKRYHDGEGGELKRTTCAVTDTYTDEEKQQILDYNNMLRSQQGASDMLKLEWDDDIACGAQEYAETCNINEHSGVKGLGENMYWSLRWDSMDAVASSKLWASEKWAYNYDTGCRADSRCGHLTQLIWSSTYKIGCGRKKCEGGGYHVCRYYPPGNSGAKPYTAGEPCSACPGFRPWCEKAGITGPLCIGNSTKDNPNTRCLLDCRNGGVINCDCKCECNGYHGTWCEKKCEDDADWALDCDDDPDYFCTGWPTWANRTCPKSCGVCKVAEEKDASFVDCDFNN